MILKKYMHGFKYSVLLMIIIASCANERKLNIDTDKIHLSDSIFLQFAIYYLPTPEKNPENIIKKIINDDFKDFSIVDQVLEKPLGFQVSYYIEKDVKNNYAVPDMELLQYFGRDISREDALELQECKQVFIMNFAFPREQVWQGLKKANIIAHDVAVKSGGLLWDEDTREIFSIKKWNDTRIKSWTDEKPFISDQIVIHVYKSDEYVRAVTLGMSKIGLPDIVVDKFSWSSNKNMGNLINLLSQSMAENKPIEHYGNYDLDIHSIKNQKAREPLLESLYDNAKALAQLLILKGTWEEGDPGNLLIEISFDRYEGKDVHARQDNLLSELFGSEDSISYIKHNQELLLASKKAKEKLPQLKKDFNSGLEPGEFIMVKAPFKIPAGGDEWMWVEISSWKGNVIKGLLKNEPFHIPSLHGGQLVEVKQEKVFDYIRNFADGTQEGNGTGIIIQKMEQ